MTAADPDGRTHLHPATSPISIGGRVFEFARTLDAGGQLAGWAVVDARTGNELGTTATLDEAVDHAHRIAEALQARRSILLDDPRCQVATLVDPIVGLDDREGALLVHAIDGTEVLLRWASVRDLLALGQTIVAAAEDAIQIAGEVGR